MQPLALEAEALASGCPRKWGRKRRHFHVLLELSNDRRICWSRPGAASSAEQRFEIRRSVRRHTTLLEKRGRRMGLESRVASHRDFSPSPGRVRPQQHQEGAHALVEGSLVSSTYEQANGKGKKAKTAKITSWSIRADVVPKLDRGEPELETATSGSAASEEASDGTE